VCRLFSNPNAETGPTQTFILLIDGEPVGTASLVAHDLDERPDLTPWLAGVFVAPKYRGRGYVGRLIAAVEQAGRSASIPTLWLYTNTAERVYARAGWEDGRNLRSPRQGDGTDAAHLGRRPLIGT
jgi:GNAT superfamily N-acetyltransferase